VSTEEEEEEEEEEVEVEEMSKGENIIKWILFDRSKPTAGCSVNGRRSMSLHTKR
jgi:hypothetical protein